MGVWQSIESAPVGRPVQVITHGGFVLKARLRSGFVNELGKQVLGWVAEDGQKYPPCWDDGVCWESNSEGAASDAPVQWRSIEDTSEGDK